MKKTTLPSEDRLIPHLTRGWTGVGDDCAVLASPKKGERLLFKTDAVVEGVHFLPTARPEWIGRKALARAISDIAAMGGRPTYSLVTLAVPPKISAARLTGIYRGLNAIARAHGVSLVGGETTRAPRLLLSIALLGTTRFAPILRSGGKPGDDLWVTGTLGKNTTKAGANHHFLFTPRVAEGRWLAQHRVAHAMMDLSDGLAADLPRLTAASRVGFKIDRAALPCARGASTTAALTHGEDYELLFAAAPQHRNKLEHWPFATRLTRIGQLCKRGTGDTPSTLGHGFDHFKKH